MIVRPRPGILHTLFAMQGSVLSRIAPYMVGVVLFACFMVVLDKNFPGYFPVAIGIGPFTLVGIALSIFLSFRNNACYERWWEARKAWGSLINDTRSLARMLSAVLPDEEGGRATALRQRNLRRISGFVHALRAQLRGIDAAEEAAPWVSRAEADKLHHCPNVPDAILRMMTSDLNAAMREGQFSDILFMALNDRITALSHIQGICERIKATPVPFGYTLLLYRTVWLYCLLLPFGLANSLGWSLPVAVAMIAYTFFGFSVIGDELEEPFGLDINDLPLNAMTRIIDRTVHDALDEPIQPLLQPKDFVLH